MVAKIELTLDGSDAYSDEAIEDALRDAIGGTTIFHAGAGGQESLIVEDVYAVVIER